MKSTAEFGRSICRRRRLLVIGTVIARCGSHWRFDSVAPVGCDVFGGDVSSRWASG